VAQVKYFAGEVATKFVNYYKLARMSAIEA
jgi:hypothetical protein